MVGLRFHRFSRRAAHGGRPLDERVVTGSLVPRSQRALRKALDRVGPGRGGAITLAGLVEEYLELHQAEPVTLSPVSGPMVIFGAATGLRPSELFGLEQHDVDRGLGAVSVRRAYANGRIKNTKTRLSTGAVPLQAKAVEALDRLPASVNPIL